MEPADLERLVDRELKTLGPLRAPRTLLPRIMTAVDQTAARPWYSRTWVAWPTAWQVASVVMLAATLAGAAILRPTVEAAISTVTFVAQVRGEVAETTRDVETVTTAMRVVWRTLLAPVVPYAFGLVFLMCAACAIFAAALNQMVFGKALR
jgi:hypothetical protein